MNYTIITDNYFNGIEFKKGLFTIEINGMKIEKIEEINNVDEVMITNSSEILDLRGKVITPGLIDSHNHFTMTALKMKFQINLRNAKSIPEIISIIEGNERKSHAGWLLAYNLDEFHLAENKLPDVYDLDKINTNKPVFITHFSEHYAVCNSTALKLANINDNTIDPQGGLIGRDLKGHINGILYDPSAMDLIKSHIPPYSLREYEEAITCASDYYLKSGLTTVKDIGGTGDDIDEEKRIQAINNVNSKGLIRIKIGVSLPIFSSEDAVRKIGLSRQIEHGINLKFTGYKIFLDGSGLSRTAWMKEEWNRNYNEADANNFGFPLWQIEEFKKVLSDVSETGAPVSIHAIGDKAVSVAIDTIVNVRNKSKYAIVHCTSPSLVDIQNMAANQISVEGQASFIYFIGDDYKANFGESREVRLFPFKDMFDAGINLCNGSDSPVTPYPPIYGIIASVSREMKTGNHGKPNLNSSQALSLDETLRSYTSNCATVMGWERIGRIAKDYIADIVVWRTIPRTFDQLLKNPDIIDFVIFNGELQKFAQRGEVCD